MEAIRALLTTLAVNFDLPILEWIQSNICNATLDKLMPYITYMGEPVTVIILAAILLLIPRTRRTGICVATALAIGVLVCNVTMKPLIARPRPYDFQLSEYGKQIVLLIEAQHDYSFPSGHTIAWFEAATVLLRHKKWAGTIAMILAICVALSRLYLYIHYPTDVLFSVFAGILIGILGDLLARKLTPKTLGYKGKYQV